MKIKLHKIITISLFTCLGMASNAHAELQSRLNGQAVYDTDLNITWLSDAGTQKSFTNAKQWVANLSVNGVTGWRLPDAKTTFNGTSYNLSEIGHLFYKELGADTLPYPPNIFKSTDPDLALFTNIKRTYYWTYNADSNLAVAYSFRSGFPITTYRTYRRYGVWAVHDGDVGGNTGTPNTAKIGDSVWEDINENGIQDANEKGLANISVNLLACNSNAVLQSTITDQSGNYLFANLANANYQIQFILPTDYHFSPQYAASNILLVSNANTTTGKTNCVYVNNGDIKVDYDAGLVPNGSGPEITIDTLTVLKATYKQKKHRLVIKANSDVLPRGAAVITASMVVNGVKIELGTLKWNKKKGFYKQKFNNIQATPNLISLNSDQGGTVTKSISIR